MSSEVKLEESEKESEKRKKKLLLLLIFAGTAFGCCVFSPMMALGNQFSHGANDFLNQCDAAIGPDPSVTVTTTPAGTSSVRADSSTTLLPSTPPYASVTFDADDPYVTDRIRACAGALRAGAPYQVPGSIRTANTGPAAACAQDLTLGYTGAGGGDPAILVRDVIYAASAATLTGQCVIQQTPVGTDSAPGGCGDPMGPKRAVLLPETVGRQAYCGQQVVSSVVSAGDLVFWDFRENAATRVGIAVSGQEIVTGNPGSSGYFRIAIPQTRDVRFKRVLGGDA